MTPLHQKKEGSAKDENTPPSCQGKPGSYTIGTGWGLCQNWVILSYLGDYDFGGFASIILALINNIIYFKTHTTSDRRIFSCFKTIMFKVALFNSPQKMLSFFLVFLILRY